MELEDLVQSLRVAYGPSGDEGCVRETIRAMAEPWADEITTDALGNLMVHRRGPGARVLFAAHMDSIGFVVTHIGKEGFLRVGALGGVSPREVLYTPVLFRNGTEGVFVPQEKADPEKLTLDECFVDIGASSAEEAGKLVQVGDPCVFRGPSCTMGNRIVSPCLDNRLSCAILLSMLPEVLDSPNDLWFVFTVQEEVGTRGVRTAAWSIDPDWGIAVDVTDVDDTPGSKHHGTTALGKGAGVKLMDSSILCHPQVVETLLQLARQERIPVQRDIMKDGGTDAGGLHLTRMGVRSGGISVPCRYIHTPVETADLGDAQACVRLAVAFARHPLEGARC